MEPTEETMPNVRAAVNKALELDETLADAHAAMAVIKRQQWDWAGAEKEFKRAIDCPSHKFKSQMYGHLSLRLLSSYFIARVRISL